MRFPTRVDPQAEPTTPPPTRLVRALVLDVPGNPFTDDDALRADSDAGLLVVDGVIAARGPLREVRAAHPDAPVEDLRAGLLLPGFVDTHVHYPQLRAIGGLGMPLLDWLRSIRPARGGAARRRRATPRRSPRSSSTASLAPGTTTALVFGSHFAPAMDVFFAHAERRAQHHLRALVLSDRALREDLHWTPETRPRTRAAT